MRGGWKGREQVKEGLYGQRDEKNPGGVRRGRNPETVDEKEDGPCSMVGIGVPDERRNTRSPETRSQ